MSEDNSDVGVPATEPLDVKVIEPSKAKTFDITGVVYRLHTDVHQLDFAFVHVVEGPVVVKDSSNRMIGSGNIVREGRDIVVHATIEAATPERLSIEIGEPYFFIADHGPMVTPARASGMLDSAYRLEFQVVKLVPFPNTDSGIDKVTID